MNRNGLVDAADKNLVKADINKGANAARCQKDVNLSGLIDSADLSFVQARIGGIAPASAESERTVGIEAESVEHLVPVGGRATVRLTARIGGGFESLMWFVDEEPTTDGEALQVELGAGEHSVRLAAYDGGRLHVVKTTVRVTTFEQAVRRLVERVGGTEERRELRLFLHAAADAFAKGDNAAAADLRDAAAVMLDDGDPLADPLLAVSTAARADSAP